MYKTIYNNDLSVNDDGFGVKCYCEGVAKELLDRFPESNPREIAHLCATIINLEASYRIVRKRNELRKENVRCNEGLATPSQ